MLKAVTVALSLSVSGLSFLSAAHAEDAALDSGMIPSPVVLLPDDAPRALVVLLSDRNGWQDEDQSEAERLKDAGAIVMGIDTAKYIDALSRDTGDCIYTVSDIEEMSHQLQRKTESTNILQPIIAGRGAVAVVVPRDKGRAVGQERERGVAPTDALGGRGVVHGGLGRPSRAAPPRAVEHI